MQTGTPITLLALAWNRDPSAAVITSQVTTLDAGITAEIADLPEVLRRADAVPPDVLLMAFDADRPGFTWSVVSSVHRASPSTGVLVHCDAFSAPLVQGCIVHGARGCVLLSSPPAFLAKAVRSVSEGQTCFGGSDLLDALRTHAGGRRIEPVPHEIPDELLTAREREILKLIGCAMSNKEIARALQISSATVKTHLHHVYVKLRRSGRYKALLLQHGAVAEDALARSSHEIGTKLPADPRPRDPDFN